MAVVIHRFAVYLVSLDPTVGSEMQKTRPGLVVSPDEMNAAIATATASAVGASGAFACIAHTCALKVSRHFPLRAEGG